MPARQAPAAFNVDLYIDAGEFDFALDEQISLRLRRDAVVHLRERLSPRIRRYAILMTTGWS